ncbi:MAG: porin family protein [Bacteroidales bacterium]|nr:porin family protein [Bacteroidales bacterium]MBQ9186081.1 porin family protein [Bacteroidales bacterium]
MKKIAVIVLLTGLFSITSLAQVPVKWNVGSGRIESVFKSAKNIKSTSFDGYYVGAGAEIALPVSYLSVFASANWDYKNFKSPAAVEFKAHYLRIPVQIKYTFGLGKVLEVYVAAGPSFNIGLFGSDFTALNNLIYTMPITPEVTNKDIFGDNGMKRFFVQGGISAGVIALSHYELRVGYEYGLSDASNLPYCDANRVHALTFGVGYWF